MINIDNTMTKLNTYRSDLLIACRSHMYSENLRYDVVMLNQYEQQRSVKCNSCSQCEIWMHSLRSNILIIMSHECEQTEPLPDTRNHAGFFFGCNLKLIYFPSLSSSIF